MTHSDRIPAHKPRPRLTRAPSRSIAIVSLVVPTEATERGSLPRELGIAAVGIWAQVGNGAGGCGWGWGAPQGTSRAPHDLRLGLVSPPCSSLGQPSPTRSSPGWLRPSQPTHPVHTVFQPTDVRSLGALLLLLTQSCLIATLLPFGA